MIAASDQQNATAYADSEESLVIKHYCTKLREKNKVYTAEHSYQKGNLSVFFDSSRSQHDPLLPSYCRQSVRLSVTKYVVAKRTYILQQKCLNK